MNKVLSNRINEEDIFKVELLCSESDNTKVISDLQEKGLTHTGKSKILIDSYLLIMYQLGMINSNLSLDDIRIVSMDNDVFHISTRDIINNRIVISDNAIRFILNIFKFIQKGENTTIKVLDLNTLDYVLYDDKNKKKSK